jgi:hypothetical protein
VNLFIASPDFKVSREIGEELSESSYSADVKDSFATSFEALLCSDLVIILFEDGDREDVQVLSSLMGAALALGRPIHVLVPRYWPLREKIPGVQYYDNLDALINEVLELQVESEIEENQ